PLAFKNPAKNPVPITYTPHPAASQPHFYQTINFPPPYKPPPIFLLQNNTYPISTPLHNQSPPQTIPQKPPPPRILALQLHPIHALPLYPPTP
ncbi:thiamine pyrophosphate-dependent enzyme, partial [Bacillus pumilus]|uniref:thiamine pyrophosphate-dependent enzyme n=1 Tax=Bacillus pumilus TaxID=1408 RepID=UPI0034D97BAE